MAFGTAVNDVREINSKEIADINLRSMELNKSTLDEIKKGFTNLEKSVKKMSGGIRIPGLQSLTDMAKSLTMMPKTLAMNLANAITAPFKALATTLTAPFIKAFTSVRDSLKATWEGTKKLFGGFFGFFGSIFGRFFGKGTDPKLMSEVKDIGKSMSNLVSMFSKFLANQQMSRLDAIEEKRDRKKADGALSKKGVMRSGNRQGGILGNLANISEIMQGFGGFTGAILATVLAGGAVAFLVARFRDQLGIDPGFSILDAVNKKSEELFGMPLFGETMTSALKSIGDAFAEGGVFNVLKESVNQMLTAFPSLQTALDGMKSMWEETKIFFEGVVQGLGLGPLRDKITEFMGKEFGIAEMLGLTAAIVALGGPLNILRTAISGLGVIVTTLGSFFTARNTSALKKLTRAILSGGLGGLGIDGDGKKPRGKRSKFQRFKNMFGFGMDDIYDMNRGGKKGVQYGSKTAGGILSLAESANIGKFAKIGGLARGVPIAGQVLAAGMAVFDGVTGASDALKTFKPQTLTDSIEVGMVGAAAGITKSFAGLADMATGLFGFDTDLAGGVTDMRDTFLKWSLGTKEKIEEMNGPDMSNLPENRRLFVESENNRALLASRLESEVRAAENMAVAATGIGNKQPTVIMDNSTSSNIQQNTTNLSGGMMTSVASGVDGALRWAFPHYGN
tara:strand:- start:14171 stop:16201 length:2031 start_codon:yes stop_codon:yes gene_type:complete